MTTFTPSQPQSFEMQARACAALHGVQIRFAAMMVHTGNPSLTKRGAAMVAFISDAKQAYGAAHPEMLSGGDVIIDQDHFTAFILATTTAAQREFDIVQRADGIQYACINEEAVFFRAHHSGTWVRTSVKPELEYFTPAGTERITEVDTNAPIFTGHNLAEISAYFKG